MPSIPLVRKLASAVTLYFSAHSRDVFIRGKSLVFGLDEEIPLARTRRVVLPGRACLTTAVLYRLMRMGIAVDWLDIFGRPIGQLVPAADCMDSIVREQAAFGRQESGLSLARQLL